MSRALKKNAQGYGYAYTDINAILSWLESEGIEMYQTIVPVAEHDYIYTYLKYPNEDWKEYPGARIAETKIIGGKENPAQALGSCITYSRRYSLMLALGLGATDDDSAALDVYFPQTKEEILDLFKKMCEKDASKKTVINVVKKKMGFEQPAKELDYAELAEIYKTVINN